MTARNRSQIVATSRKRPAKGAALVNVSETTIEGMVLLLRGERVILDSDLAELYGVETKVLNQAVKRNIERFPDDFLFQLTWEEARYLKSLPVTSNRQAGRDSRSQSVTLKKGWNLKYRPRVFTEHGAIMAANVLNSPRAVQASVFVVRVFVRLRRLLVGNKELATRLDELERKLRGHDRQIIALVDAIRQLMAPPPNPSREPIGFASETLARKPTRTKGQK